MALLVDGGAPSVEELQRYEAGVIDMANTEGIDLGAKALLAREQITTELLELLGRNGNAWERGVADRIVLTEPLRRWLAAATLAAAFEEARLNQVSARYEGKRATYARMAVDAKMWLTHAGIGLVSAPLRRPAAPAVELIAGAGAGSYFFRYAWAAANGEESEASEPVVATLSANGGVRLTVGEMPAGAVGWNVFAGSVEAEAKQQNLTPIAGGEHWDWTLGVIADGRSPKGGQAAESFQRIPNVLLRG